MSNDKFKNAPIHDKKAIIDMMDELEPKDMIEVVELIKSKQQKPDTQQTAVEQFLNTIKDQILLSKEHLEMIESYASQAKKIEKEQHRVTAEDFYYGNWSYEKFNDYYNEIYGGNK